MKDKIQALKKYAYNVVIQLVPLDPDGWCPVQLKDNNPDGPMAFTGRPQPGDRLWLDDTMEVIVLYREFDSLGGAPSLICKPTETVIKSSKTLATLVKDLLAMGWSYHTCGTLEDPSKSYSEDMKEDVDKGLS